jgi:hypothetical protein
MNSISKEKEVEQQNYNNKWKWKRNWHWNCSSVARFCWYPNSYWTSELNCFLFVEIFHLFRYFKFPGIFYPSHLNKTHIWNTYICIYFTVIVLYLKFVAVLHLAKKWRDPHILFFSLTLVFFIEFNLEFALEPHKLLYQPLFV